MDGMGNGGSGTNGINAENRAKLDALFEAFSIVAEGTYVYLCDMEYD